MTTQPEKWRDVLTSLASHKDSGSQQMCPRVCTEGCSQKGLGKKWFIFLKSRSLIPFYFSSTFSHQWRCTHRLSVWTQRVFELGTIMQLWKVFYRSFLALYSYVKKYNSNVPTYVRIWFHSDSGVSVRKFSIPCCESWLLVSYIWERKYRAFEMV